MTAHFSSDTAPTPSHTAPTPSRIHHPITHHAATFLTSEIRPSCLHVLRLEQHITTVFEQACDELGEDFRYDDELDDSHHVVRFPRLLPFSACVLTCEIASLYCITDYDARRHTLEHLLDNNTYMLRAVDRSLPVDVRYLHLSSRGLCLADRVLS
jgi:hypothetical protein